MRRVAAMCGILCLLAGAVARADDAAERQMVELLQGRHVRTVLAAFVCVRQIGTQDPPLVTSGTLYAERPDSARYSTTQPYRSDLILEDGKVYARTQHENDWTKSNQSSKPGLTAVAGQMAAWSVGEPRKLEEYYSVQNGSAEIPAAPVGAAGLEAKSARQFELTPDHRDLKKVVERIRVAFDASTKQLRFVQINAVGGEVITYWFAPADDVKLPKDIFEPKRER